ncbi:hypothetical protein ACFS2C_00020 [Prauserella oleivorans]|uniref:Uncharacterized protein n=2 Tax=Prauserella oleivorans TaxID=1478153 RepID=A0ABW5W1S5_9PSEU
MFEYAVRRRLGMGVAGVERGFPERWFLAVSAGVAEALDELVARAAAQGGPVASDVSRLVAAWRLLLHLHERAGSHGCGCCGKQSGGRLCTVWQVAVGYFLRRLPIDREPGVQRRPW